MGGTTRDGSTPFSRTPETPPVAGFPRSLLRSITRWDAGEEWTAGERKVERYLARADEFPHRMEGENVFLAHVPLGVLRVLDLGTGDGRLLALLLDDRPEVHGVGLDFSELMLGPPASVLPGTNRSSLSSTISPSPCHCLGVSTRSSRRFHPPPRARAQACALGEVFDLLEPGGVFANFEHVASRAIVCTWPSSPPSRSRSRMRTPPTGCSMSRPSSPGCASSVSTMSTAIGSGWRWRFSSVSSR